jgi:hypothetical protein
VSKGHEILTAAWLQVLRDDPERMLEAVLLELMEQEESSRQTVARSFVALMYGPRVDPDTAEYVLARSGSIDSRSLLRDGLRRPEFADLQRKRQELERKVAEVKERNATDLRLADECADVKERIANKRLELENARRLAAHYTAEDAEAEDGR